MRRQPSSFCFSDLDANYRPSLKHRKGTPPPAVHPSPTRRLQAVSFNFETLGEAVDVDSEAYCWRRSGFFWRMRASLGLARAQATTLCTQVFGKARRRSRAGRPHDLSNIPRLRWRRRPKSAPPPDSALCSLFISLFFLPVRAALKLRSLNLPPLRLNRIAVISIKSTLLSLIIINIIFRSF